jgi:hypothetical protein
MRGSTIEIAWMARTRYKGGAAPSAEVMKQSTRDARGAFAVDRRTGAVSQTSSTLPLFPCALPAAASDDPNVLQRARHADRIYELVVEREAGVARTVLRALDDTNRTVWQLIVDEGPARAPRGLRP